MRAFQSLALAASVLLRDAGAALLPMKAEERALEWVVKPKVFIISMFDPEAEVWWGIPEFDILVRGNTSAIGKCQY